ncbi:hypothetical protein PAXRUDRAFT_324779 [Paxillus rubicundulus Ve08.2h10]|uniref:Uncharacterized protein n=1 Tax=Paxillus rubicundulus Ve08.2h10 TaxID=930991 RepID=A0A0D0DZS9_9AGAM|nr:hypothetical protein PAXRUDRAFT_324779 [Paxillus rubicundulus Ve08.2h10]
MTIRCGDDKKNSVAGKGARVSMKEWRGNRQVGWARTWYIITCPCSKISQWEGLILATRWSLTYILTPELERGSNGN